MYGLPCILTLLLRQKHCKHYQNKHLWTPLLPCAVCPTSFFVFAGIWRSQGNTVFPPQCFPPLFRFNNNSKSLWARTSTQVKKPLNINVCREVNFLHDIINGTIFFILIKLQIFYILLSYSPTSFKLPLHQNDSRSEEEEQNQISKMNSESTLHCCKAHFAESTESNLKHMQKKTLLNHGNEMQIFIGRRLYTWHAKNELKNYIQKQPHNNSDLFCITALDNYQTRKTIK